jgi:hemoglobin
MAVLAGADNAYAQAQQTMPEISLYERLGGVFAIAAVVNHFSDAVVKNSIVGQKSRNPQLREWHTKNLGRLPGQVHANAVGLQRFGWALPVHSHQAWHDAARP